MLDEKQAFETAPKWAPWTDFLKSGIAATWRSVNSGGSGTNRCVGSSMGAL